MNDEGNRKLYLIFGTQHELGLEKMKDAMWKVDPSYGVRYRDPRDEKGRLTRADARQAPLPTRLRVRFDSSNGTEAQAGWEPSTARADLVRHSHSSHSRMVHPMFGPASGAPVGHSPDE
ncbi:hypothetical protein [Streptomyces sp. TLI_185]|uniref:hypothetical protein n=1 Tax=Streptomyces sp. TLI_185 TaxID=2485151 RepID=UPI0021A4E0DD|nr:hypothetical protein [Streptomyces sp. TLI_185]